MSVELDESLVKSAYEVISTTATPMESKENKEKPETIIQRYAPRFQVTLGNRMKWLKSNGITNDVLDKLTHCDQAWNAAAAQFAAEKAKELVPSMLKDKEFMTAAGPKYLKATVFTSLKDGKRGITVTGYTENRNPRATGEDDAITTSYGSIQVHQKVTRPFAEEVANDTRAMFEKLLKEKF